MLNTIQGTVIKKNVRVHDQRLVVSRKIEIGDEIFLNYKKEKLPKEYILRHSFLT